MQFKGSAIQGFFHNSVILKAINHTIISLIPKVDCPIEIKQFRPISLCQVVYKALAKILVNRLKRFLSRCISKNQSAFVLGRQILDNVILSHELLHFLKNKRAGRNGFMAIKLDMSKAYDRVEWIFLARIMEKMGFCSKWIQWIMECVTTITYAVNTTGEKTGFIRPTRGLRQGDLLSPYLFLLCAEGFTSLIKQSNVLGKLTGMRIAHGAPYLSHLFFAGDSLIFCKAKGVETGELKRILKVYKEASGQVINVEKSTLFFSKNVAAWQRTEVMDELQGMKQVM